MGCGAICGDSVAEAGSTAAIAIRTMQALLPSLNKTSLLISKQTYSTFLSLYHQDPKRFHLFPKKNLLRDQPISQDVLLRWKLVLFGLDSDKKYYCECLGLSEEAEPLASEGIIPIESNMQSSIIYHECFIQIEKDLDRTFSLTGGRKQDFENVLKRIANFFPKMGYTQGINFVVGFLIIAGYSQNDTFWIFVHIALNRRFLLLGLYQDGFPLSNVFCIVFRNMLKRTNQPLYLHVFQILAVDISMWVFKWFITCFTYSFPLEMAKYAWETIIQLGSLGIVALAISLTDQLGPFLLEKEDMCEFSEFMKNLGEVQVFNHFVNMERVLKRVYNLEVVPSDFEGVESSGGFYGEYLKSNCVSLQRHLLKEAGLPKFSDVNQKSEQTLDTWYKSLLEDRLRFQEGSKKVVSNELAIESNQKIKNKSHDEEIQLILFTKEEQSTAPEGKVNQESNHKSLTVGRSDLQTFSYRVSYPFDKINERLQEESISAKSKQQSQHLPITPSSRKRGTILDIKDLQQLDKLEIEVYKKGKQKVKINNFAAPQPRKSINTDNSRDSRPQSQRSKDLVSKHPHKMMGMRAANTFTMTGQNILNIDNYDAISVSSRNASNKERIKTNQHAPVQLKGRSCACKTKTQQNKFSSIDKSSEVASSKGQFSDKDSVCNSVSKGNMSHTEQNIADLNAFSMKNVDTFRQRLDRVQSNDHYMICSHGPTVRENQGRTREQPSIPKEKTDIEVQVLPFKKDKRPKQGRVSHIEISKRQGGLRTRGIVQPSEESLDSVPAFSFDQLSQVNSCKRETKCDACGESGCEIQSIR